MTQIELSSVIEIREIQTWGGDHMIAAAAKVSTDPEQSRILEDIEDADGLYGLIRYLAKQRHTSPFEHCGATFYVEAPIFVFREWHRHRIASYSEMSGRYTKLMPKFWIPRIDRPLVPVEGYKSSRPVFGPADEETRITLENMFRESYQTAWDVYEAALQMNVAKEVARAPLPVAIYSKMWATTNLHSWLHFLSLRTHHPDALFVSFPQFEINEAADKVEAVLTECFPLALRAFNETGRSF